MSVDIYKLETQDANILQSRVSQDMGLLETYHYLIENATDPRVINWPLLGSPFPLLAIILSYLAFVCYLGPLFMKNRKPYKLNTFMICYNVFVAGASAVAFYGILTSGFTTTLSLGCEPVTLSYEAEPYNLARWMWWVLILKIVEFGDTIIFVLRKKFNQASFLHVYHHASTATLSWIATKYVPGGMWAFTIIPNCAVHVVMYTYYLLACLGPEMQRRLAPWKRYVTRLQLIQFVIMILHLLQAFEPSCNPQHRPVAVITMSQVVTMFTMFCDYYKKSYVKTKTA